jgi:hypothetical protein
MGDLADAMEGSELNSVVTIFGNDDSSSEESSKLDLDDSVDETDSASQKRLTLNVVNNKFTRKITNMSGKMQRRNDKYKREKKKADKQRSEDKMFFQTLFSNSVFANENLSVYQLMNLLIR